MDKTALLKKFGLIVIGQSGGQIIRLVSNLVLTRLLVPEMFGVMAVMNSILLGLKFLTDVGLRGSVMNTSDIESNQFLETIWTSQLIRGFLLYITLVFIAKPTENYLQIDNLSTILYVLGTVIIIDSFISINALAYQREMKIKELVIIDISSQIVGAVAMIVLALIYKSIWALVCGSIISSLMRTATSHLYLSGFKSRLGWNAVSFKNIFSYGKWIFLSTFGAYLVTHGDKIIFAKFIDLPTLGIFTIASSLAMVVTNVFSALSGKILFPMYSQLARDGQRDLYNIFRLRISLIAGSFILIFLINLLSEQIVAFMYDDRYKNAGWMLQVLSLGGMLRILDLTLRPLLLANKDSYSAMKVQLLKSVLFVIGLTLGLYYFGIAGGAFAVAILQIGGQGLLLRYVTQYGYHWRRIEYAIISFIILSFILSWYLQDESAWRNILSLWSSIMLKLGN